ncbi:MAG: DUF4410 domain-containing protein [Desulfopila sp.]|jgi:hypothetical protein|nr:DUF4410 domain-containing protein [Desulfopila sp.]
MKHLVLSILLVMTALVLSGCPGAKMKAPLTPDGKSYSLAVLCDRGITGDKTPAQIEQLNQLGVWAERDLMWMLGRAGYNARQINSRSEFNPSSGEYLLSVKVIKYNPGSKAARIMVGFGAGSCSLDRSYELYGDGPKPLLSRDQGVSSSIDYSAVVQKLNQEMIDEVTRTFMVSGG